MLLLIVRNEYFNHSTYILTSIDVAAHYEEGLLSGSYFNPHLHRCWDVMIIVREPYSQNPTLSSFAWMLLLLMWKEHPKNPTSILTYITLYQNFTSILTCTDVAAHC